MDQKPEEAQLDSKATWPAPKKGCPLCEPVPDALFLGQHWYLAPDSVRPHLWLLVPRMHITNFTDVPELELRFEDAVALAVRHLGVTDYCVHVNQGVFAVRRGHHLHVHLEL